MTHASPRLFISLFFGLGLIDIVPLQASQSASLQDLALVERAASSEIERLSPASKVEAQPIDRRLQLQRCAQPLQVAVPTHTAIGVRVNARVTCPAPGIPWSVTVAVNVSTEASVVIANRPIPLGSTITHSDVRLEARTLPGTARCCAQDINEVVGLLVRRSIPADGLVVMDALDRPPIVKRGEIVMVVAALPGVEIRSSGVALADAHVGETVRIRHSTSLKVIQARADTPGVVRVDR